MRKATLVLATSVAFLVSGAAFAVTGSRTSTISSASDLVKNGTIVDAAGNLVFESAKSGVYIPAGATASTEVAVATKTVGTVAKAAVGNAVKAAVRANGAVIAVNGAIAAATAAVDWLKKDGSYVKKSSGGTAVQDSRYFWTQSQNGTGDRYSTATEACLAYGSNHEFGGIQMANSYTARCLIKDQPGAAFATFYSYSSTCPDGSTFNSSIGGCFGPGGTSPLTESDYNDLGDWVQQQDGTFVRQAAIEGCYLSVNPDACFDSVVPDRKLTGPSTVTGTPVTTSKTVSTTSPDGTVTTGTSTTTTTPAATVTYNNQTNNNVTYNTYNKTITKNPDGSTTEETSDEGGPPNVPDLTSTAFGPIDGLPADIIDTGAKGSSLPFFSWFSMGGQCKEHTFQLPVVGALTTNYCPIHEAYVRPFLYFIFSVWTFIYCFQIWRESTVRVRIM